MCTPVLWLVPNHHKARCCGKFRASFPKIFTSITRVTLNRKLVLLVMKPARINGLMHWAVFLLRRVLLLLCCVFGWLLGALASIRKNSVLKSSRLLNLLFLQALGSYLKRHRYSHRAHGCQRS